jgi:SagB-type dehydrogenase family enzyme
MFREKYPLAWTFHKNTSRNELNSLNPQPGQNRQESYKEYLHAPETRLPDAKLPDDSFSDLLSRRFSCRNFSSTPVTLQQVSNILHAGYGRTGISILDGNEFPERTVPSGGGLYPLELYVLAMQVESLQPGVYHYVMNPPLLELVKPIVLPKILLNHIFMQQPYAVSAPLMIVCTAILHRSMKKYADRGYRYLLLEAGHAFQNMNCMATACGLASLNLGGFYDDDLSKVLGVDTNEEIPLYVMTVGKPQHADKTSRIPAM